MNILFISFRFSNGESSIARETFFFIQKLLNSGGDKLNSEFHIYKLQQRNAFFQVVCLMERYDDDFVSGNENEGTMFQVLKFFYLFICLTNEILINHRLKYSNLFMSFFRQTHIHENLIYQNDLS